MQMNLADLAWLKAQSIYGAGDVADQAGIKALREGYIPGTEEYAAFVSGFLELVSANHSTGS